MHVRGFLCMKIYLKKKWLGVCPSFVINFIYLFHLMWFKKMYM